ncbi:hypothetical protein G6F43_001109 [Rhizopus delemar]|nr:hypothetical protein G6F43_001109 [Rhizopus delemar]
MQQKNQGESTLERKDQWQEQQWSGHPFIRAPFPTLPPVHFHPYSSRAHRPRLTTTLWEDENTICYQVDIQGTCVARRQDNDMINGTKLLNVAGMSRGKRDGILKNEKGRVVVKVGAMHLKGVWIPFARAKVLANQFNILDILYPIFADNPASFVYPSHFRHLHDASMMSPYQAETSTEACRHYSIMNKRQLTTAACCIIGDEILNGKTRDSNAYFLGTYTKYLFDLGIDLRRVETIPDDYDAIAETIKRLSSQHNLVFTRPTHDDITYSAIAKAYSLPLILDQETCQLMETSSKQRFPNWELTEERKRMATFPEPSIKLRPDKNFWVPVVIVNKNIHILPGIPKLFEGLMSSLKPHFQEMVGDQKGYHRIQVATSLAEGDIAQFLTTVQSKVKDIKIGSYPKWGLQNGVRVVVSVVEAVNNLNSLQSSAILLEKLRKAGPQKKKPRSLDGMKVYLRRIGYEPKDFDKLNLIHITGTKGKGSTCALTQSILHHYDPTIKTGMFTSPHLVAVRERIRINGQPIKEELFAKYFQDVWKRLEATKETVELSESDSTRKKLIQSSRLHPDKPAYFRYLTLVALHTFIQEKVDCAILEVGIGGEYDSTNIIETPIVCGITALGLDHVSKLGKTIDKIAWHKSGIIKPNVPAVCFEQMPEAMQVTMQRAQVKNAPLMILNAKQASNLNNIEIGLAGEHQKYNALIAIELCKIWLKSVRGIKFKETIPKEFKEGLKNVSWPGRGQLLDIKDTKYASKGSNIVWYLDGAHTVESLQVCTEWFQQALCQKEGYRILVFNCTHGRNSYQLLEVLSKLQPIVHFEDVIFTTNITFKEGYTTDNTNNNVSTDEIAFVQHTSAIDWITLNPTFPKSHIYIVGTIEEAVELVVNQSNKSIKPTQILITGSLIMVGLLHSIFFHRLLGTVAPRELRVLNTTVSITDSQEVEKLIEEKITEFLQNTISSHIKQGKLAVLFYEKRLKKNWLSFSKGEELVCWEQWNITLHLTSSPGSEHERFRATRQMESQLSQCLLTILKIVNEQKEHIPSITTIDANPFPYQIATQSQTESWGTMIKRMLVTDPPS